MEARVFALLLLSNPLKQSFSSITKTLAASKSAVSVALRKLINTDKVVSITVAGERKRYFRAQPEGWLQQLQAKLTDIEPLTDVLDSVIARRSNSKFRDELMRLHTFLAHLRAELPAAIAHWEAEN